MPLVRVNAELTQARVPEQVSENSSDAELSEVTQDSSVVELSAVREESRVAENPQANSQASIAHDIKVMSTAKGKQSIAYMGYTYRFTSRGLYQLFSDY